MFKQSLSLAVLWYLKALAKIQLKKVSPQIIGITGTAGKTSTQAAAAAVLKDAQKIKIGHKANSESGIPLNILGLGIQTYKPLEWLKLLIQAPIALVFNWDKYDTYIVEMAIDSPEPPKNMTYLLSIIQPHIGVFLNAKPMHSLQFDHLAKATKPGERSKEIAGLIAEEKGKLITSLPNNGFAILNIDDPEVAPFQKRTKAKVITFGVSEKADIQIKSVKPSLKGTEFKFAYDGNNLTLRLSNYVLPNYFGHTFAAALAVAVSQNIPPEAAIRSISKNLALPPGRSSLIAAKNGSFIIDSSYNSSADPTIGALELLNSIAPKKKYALLGDIRELGSAAAYEHQRVAKKAAEVCDAVALVGPQMKEYVLPILEAAGKEAHWFPNASAAAVFFQDKLSKDDVLLVKGSQNTLLLEIAVEKLMLHPEDAEKLLCRRGGYWNDQRDLLLANKN